ncbi:MAG: transcription antitermination factor NusB [Roseibacillus sp.]|nr:transcription antitermination factor NusB [Roseibacillus sp.]
MPDTPRRRMREAVVQFLYALQPSEPLPESLDPSILHLLLESLRDKSTKARAKAILHLQQGRDKHLESFDHILGPLDLIGSPDPSDDIEPHLKEWREAEERLQEHLEGIRRELNGNRESARLRESMSGAHQSNRASIAAADAATGSTPTLPALREAQELAVQLKNRIAPLFSRLSLALGNEFTELPELRAVARAEKELAQTSSSIELYYGNLRGHLEKVDKELATVIDNYSPDRLDRVDRAILRLGGYELLFDPSIPNAVAINEAIELARAFGTTDSPSFINGVLDQVAKIEQDVSGEE